jgi:hypothetical protein
MSNVIQELKEFAQIANSYHGKMLERVKEDLEFAGSNQYDKKDRNIRGDDRAELTFNFVRNYANQIINEYRAKPFGITISAKKTEALQKAELAQGIVRGVEAASDADSAYTLAIDRQVKGGIGYVLVGTEYTYAQGFEQDIKITGIYKPDMVIYDPHSLHIAGEDASQAAVVEHISEDVAEEMLGEKRDWKYISSPISGTSWKAPEDSVALITYFRVKRSKRSIYQGENGVILEEKDIPEAGRKGVRSRVVEEKSVCVYKIVGEEVIEETELPITRIPLIPFRGEVVDTNGKIDWVGLTYFARDPQKLINYAASLTAERISIGPKSTTFVDMRSIAPYKDVWGKSNKINVPYLPFDSKDSEGNPYTPPVARDVSVNITDVTSAQSNYQQMMAGVLGMQEQGSRIDGASNETAASVLTRQKSAEISNYQYLDNASKSVKAVGRLILELMNIVYDTDRLVPVATDERGSSLESINVVSQDIIPDELEVNVDSGPMLETMRQQSIAQLIALGQMVGPDVALVFADDIVRSSDIPNAEEIATKLSAVAKMKFGIGNDATNNPDPEAIAALEQASAAVEKLESDIRQYQAYIQQMQVEKEVASIEAKSRLIVAQMNNDTKVYIEQMKIASSDQQEQAKLQEAYDKSQSDARLELLKLYAQQPDVSVVQAAPRLQSIGGMRSNLDIV